MGTVLFAEETASTHQFAGILGSAQNNMQNYNKCILHVLDSRVATAVIAKQNGVAVGEEHVASRPLPHPVYV